VLCIKVAHRFYTTTAVSDIILLCKTKRAPMGYNYIGEINNHLLCIKFSQIPTGSNHGPAPPIPPRPVSIATSSSDSDGFVHVNRQPSPPTYPPSSVNGHDGNLNLFQSQVSIGGYNPLNGVPFQINPAYKFENSDSQGDDIVVGSYSYQNILN
jgi:hypothetical protein